MAKPLARVLALLDILQTGGTRTLRELSDRLGVDERTVRRYVGHLLDLDVPVESVRGGTAVTGSRRATGCRRSCSPTTRRSLCFSAWSAHAARPCSRTPRSQSRARPP